MTFWEGFWPVVLVAGHAAFVAGTMLAVLTTDRFRPTPALTWLLVAALLPWLGPALYWFIGRPWLSESRRRRMQEMTAEIHWLIVHKYPIRREDVVAMTAGLEEGDRGLGRLGQSIGGMPPVGGNGFRLYDESADLFAAMIADIDAARSTVHFLTYIVLDDQGGLPVMEALMRAAGRGVEVRFLVDALGSRPFLRGETCGRLREAGVAVVEALPSGPLRSLFNRIDLRNHRKIAVIDGEIGYVGSHNLADKSFRIKPKFAPWIDATARMHGPVVSELQRVFVEDWYLETGESRLDTIRLWGPSAEPTIAQVIPTGPLKPDCSATDLVVTLLGLARDEIVLTTPYFVPDSPTIAALTVAARRGVQVRLVVPARNDSLLVAHAARAFYATLLEAGVEIAEFQGGLLHAKTISVDSRVAFISSANLDRRSFELNEEVSLLLYDGDATRSVRALQGRYLERSGRIEATAWRRRPLSNRLADNAAALLSAVL
jgi:cardiolipin synthase